MGTNKIDINKATNSGDSALSIASTHQHTEVVALLLESGADVGLRDYQGRIPLQHTTALLRNGANITNKEAFEEIVRLLTKSGSSPRSRDEDGDTPLHFAAGANFKQVIRNLLVSRANPNQRNKRGDRPVDSAPVGETKLRLLAFQGAFSIYMQLQFLP